MQAPRDSADGTIQCVIGSHDGFRVTLLDTLEPHYNLLRRVGPCRQ